MIEPRRKEWLFDDGKILRLLFNFQSADKMKANDFEMQILEFIQAEIERNVREFAEKVRPSPLKGDTTVASLNCFYEAMNSTIKAALKARGVE